MQSIGEGWMWFGFMIFVVCAIVADLYVFDSKKAEAVSTRKAAILSCVWVACALVFGFCLWLYLGHTTTQIIADQKTEQFLTGYIVEKSLSVDNLFVFLMIFSYFQVPLAFQRRVLAYGVIGAVILRLGIILLGTWVIAKIQWILYFFGAFLGFTGIKILLSGDDDVDFKNSRIVKWLSKHLRLTKDFHQEKFFIKQNALYYATPLFLVLILIEISDIIFAVDSIPAVFAITLDSFIVFTSNVFAILGLRALYFLLANMAEQFTLLKYGIAPVLVLVGVKMLIEPWVQISSLTMLIVIVLILGVTFLMNWYLKDPHDKRN